MMRSKIARRILDETPNEVREFVRKYGDKVMLDSDFNNKSEVTIVKPGTLISVIKDEEGNEWSVMTDRLSPISGNRSY